MIARNAAFILIGGLCLAQVDGAGRELREPPQPAVVPLRPPERTEEEKIEQDHTYRNLRWGVRLYAGTVVEVSVDEKRGEVDGAHYERGHIRFRVTRTVIGEPKKELVLPYDWDAYFVPLLGADWGGSDGRWPGRPQVGEHLLLLLLPENEAVCREVFNTAPTWPVLERWQAEPDSPLSDGFALAGRFLTAEDHTTQEKLFVQLCRSPLWNMRQFAQEAAFAYLGWNPGRLRPSEGPPKGGRGVAPGWNRHFWIVGGEEWEPYGGDYDPVWQSHLALLYLKHAGSQLCAAERKTVTGTFAGWARNPRAFKGVTEELKSAFEDWYVGELSVRDDDKRVIQALKGLSGIAKERGTATTTGLFKKAGRDGLLAKLRECDKSGDPKVTELSQGLLTRFEKP